MTVMAMDIRLRVLLSVVMGLVPFIHVFLTQGRHMSSFIPAIILAILHYLWLMNVDEFEQPLTPLYITLDSLLLNGLLYGAFVSCTLLL